VVGLGYEDRGCGLVCLVAGLVGGCCGGLGKAEVVDLMGAEVCIERLH